MAWLSPEHLQHLITCYGYWAVGMIIGLESMGIPLPGEIVLVLAALYAGTQPDLSIWGVVASAVLGAILGDFGLGAYVLGKALLQLTRPLATGPLIVGAVFIVIAVLFVRAHEAEFQARAERAFPGPMRRVG